LPIHTALRADSVVGGRKPYQTSWSQLVSILLISTIPHGGINKNYPFTVEGRRGACRIAILIKYLGKESKALTPSCFLVPALVSCPHPFLRSLGGGENVLWEDPGVDGDDNIKKDW